MKRLNVSRLFFIMLWSLGVACQGADSGEKSEPKAHVVLGDAETIASFDYTTALVTHGLQFAENVVDAKTLKASQRAGLYACKMAQREESEPKAEPSAVEPLSEEFNRELERRGADPYLGLEVARYVAACYAKKLGKKPGSALAKAMFLSLASNCASRRGSSSDAMSKLMLALYDSQEVSLSAYLATVARAKSRPAFSKHLFHGTEVCPQIASELMESVTASSVETQSPSVEEEGRVYVGILRGRAPGRVRLVVKERGIEGVVTIGSKKLTVDGKIGRFNTLNMTGRLGMESIELRGKLKKRARKIRGRYNGKIRRRNQPRASRVIGFWEAKLEVEPTR